MRRGHASSNALDARASAWLARAMCKAFLRIALFWAAILAASAPAHARVEISVDLDRQRMTIVKNHGETIVWKISSGRRGFETPTGRFIVQRMDAEHFSDEYDQAPMPFAIFFSRGLAIHGTSERGLGSPRSHGCVRLSIPNARELYSWVEQYGAAIEISGQAGAAADLGDEGRASRRRARKGGRPRSTTPPSDLVFERNPLY